MIRLPRPGTLIPVIGKAVGTYYVRVTQPVARCSSCHARILWTRTQRDRAMPVNAKKDPMKGWLPHFATCPQSKAWQRSGKGERA